MCNLSSGIEYNANMKAAHNMLLDGVPAEKVKQYMPNLSDSDIMEIQKNIAKSK